MEVKEKSTKLFAYTENFADAEVYVRKSELLIAFNTSRALSCSESDHRGHLTARFPDIHVMLHKGMSDGLTQPILLDITSFLAG
jgi:hypothetical protein